MPTLHIEHSIKDFATWHAAFERFAERRRHGGVQAERVLQPIDDDRYIIVELDFATADQAQTFLQLLEREVWSNPSNSPALVGAPRTRIVDAAPVAP